MENLIDFNDALKYIDENWPFNSKNYPITENYRAQQLQIFSLSHVLKHVQEGMCNFMLDINHLERHGKVRDDNETYQHSMTKMLVNALQFVNISYTFVQKDRDKLEFSEIVGGATFFDYLYEVGEIAGQSEISDHFGALDIRPLQSSAKRLVDILVSLIIRYEGITKQSVSDILKNIPNVVKIAK